MTVSFAYTGDTQYCCTQLTGKYDISHQHYLADACSGSCSWRKAIAGSPGSNEMIWARMVGDTSTITIQGTAEKYVLNMFGMTKSCVSQHPGLFPLHFNAAYQPHNSNSLFSQLFQCCLCKAYHWPGLAIMVGSISRQSVYPCVLCDFRPFVVDRDVLVNSSLGLPHSATTFWSAAKVFSDDRKIMLLPLELEGFLSMLSETLPTILEPFKARILPKKW